MEVPLSLVEASLKRYFGFATFRPHQEAIVRAALAGKDVLAVLPTGGGKSLCFQLPALIQPGLTVVVSPLIALMKDQVDALHAAGVPATFLNSSLSPGESLPRLRGLGEGKFRLLYVAPERLLMPGFVDDLKRWPVNRFAIDEAHCISDWGHDFRPEYRQLATLRDAFPETPLMALTATATARVQEDIRLQLNLRSPACFVASFNRPNLTYRVQPKAGARDHVLTWIRQRPNESGIVYTHTRKSAEMLATRLLQAGIRAAPYHAGMDPADRGRNQEGFLRDEIQVICATIAFGMGVHKPNVRFVIHHDLPKNIEGYYQETGRAGRDGLPSDCLLLFSASDRVKQLRFIGEKPDPQERERARSQLEQVMHYAETAGCRRAFLLGHFGEAFHAPGGCGGCDNCLVPRSSWDGTVAAQKLLSCVYRIREHSGFGVGLQHVVEVLTGAATEKIARWNHSALSTYGIGKEHSRPEWATIGRELIRLGYLRQDPDRFNVLELTTAGRAILASRAKVPLTRTIPSPQKPRSQPGALACDEHLFEVLRQLRRKLADERSVPADVIFSDVALRHMARELPQTEAAFARICGVGETKLREFAPIFTRAIREWLQTHEHRPLPDSPAPPR